MNFNDPMFDEAPAPTDIVRMVVSDLDSRIVGHYAQVGMKSGDFAVLDERGAWRPSDSPAAVRVTLAEDAQWEAQWAQV